METQPALFMRPAVAKGRCQRSRRALGTQQRRSWGLAFCTIGPARGVSSQFPPPTRARACGSGSSARCRGGRRQHHAGTPRAAAQRTRSRPDDLPAGRGPARDGEHASRSSGDGHVLHARLAIDDATTHRKKMNRARWQEGRGDEGGDPGSAMGVQPMPSQTPPPAGTVAAAVGEDGGET